METLAQRLKAIAKPSKWREKAEYRRDNEYWLNLTLIIALNILNELDRRGEEKLFPSTKEDLSNLTGIDLETINKVVQGRIDLKLSQLVKLEEALEIKLINIQR